MKLIKQIGSATPCLLAAVILCGALGAATLQAQPQESNRPPGAPAEPPRVGEGIRAANNQLEQLREKLKDLVNAGQMDRAAQVKQQIGEIQTRLQAGQAPQALANLKERLLNLQTEIKELRQNGQNEAANKLEQQTRELAAKLSTESRNVNRATAQVLENRRNAFPPLPRTDANFAPGQAQLNPVPRQNPTPVQAQLNPAPRQNPAPLPNPAPRQPQLNPAPVRDVLIPAPASLPVSGINNITINGNVYLQLPMPPTGWQAFFPNRQRQAGNQPGQPGPYQPRQPAANQPGQPQSTGVRPLNAIQPGQPYGMPPGQPTQPRQPEGMGMRQTPALQPGQPQTMGAWPRNTIQPGQALGMQSGQPNQPRQTTGMNPRQTSNMQPGQPQTMSSRSTGGFQTRQPEGNRPASQGGRDLEQRLPKLLSAIENLRAAGMQGEADRLMREAESWKRQLAERRQPAQPREGNAISSRAWSELQSAVQELRQAVIDLRKNVEQLANQRRNTTLQPPQQRPSPESRRSQSNPAPNPAPQQ